MNTTLTQGGVFWLATAAVLALAIFQRWHATPTGIRPLLFVAAQFGILVWGLHIPALVVMIFAGFAVALFGIVSVRGMERFLWIVALALGVMTLWRQQVIAALVHAFGAWSPGTAYLTIGFSYVALRMISFVFDLQGGKIASSSLYIFLAYLFFAPTFVAGPIDRYNRFADDFRTPKPLTREVFLSSMHRIVFGLVKKLILVSFLAKYSLSSGEAVFQSMWTGTQLWLGIYAYAWLLYLDFSGYSDLAIGTGRLFGIQVPENFRWPYFQRNIIEFWNAWHITLSQWLRDYVFLPLGQVLFRASWLRGAPLLIAGTAYIVTMALCGLWHGMALHFLCWGVYHGAGLWICKASKVWTDRRLPEPLRRWWTDGRTGRCVSTVVTFHFVAFGWLLFLFDLPTAGDVVRGLSGGR